MLLVVTGLLFMAWTFLEYRQLDERVARKRYRNGWAIGGWLVPFGNLWIPYLIVQDIWTARVASTDGAPTAAAGPRVPTRASVVGMLDSRRLRRTRGREHGRRGPNDR